MDLRGSIISRRDERGGPEQRKKNLEEFARWQRNRPRGLSCKACMVLRGLEPHMVPASCEQCGKVDLLEENEEIWEMLISFPGVIRSDMGGLSVDYQSAIYVMERMGINDTGCLQKLEAIVRGYRVKR